KVTALDKNDKLLAEVTARVLRLATFKDIEPGYWARQPVEELATLGIINGYTDGAFRPNGPISRAEFATILAKLKGSSSMEGKTAAYPDVPADYWAARYIAAAAGQGLITGYPDQTFRPTYDINRVEAIVIIARFADLTVSPAEPVVSYYADIAPQHWAVKLVESARRAGYLDYIKGAMFEPEKVFTRGEACYVLSRTAFVEQHHDRLLDFERGY
ncbi:MAG TPA: S-layer homology domain-containing protein, partial [Candidatus Sulfotelmatobacter sp.]|nr:S-layer homology domain-containing protein [Candidatus Sulfotelmatobacter sp.]